MKTCIVGAGAIGGLIGVRLAAAGHPVSVLARGQTLRALRERPWRLETPQGALEARVQAGDDTAAFGVQDLVVLSVKQPSLAAVMPALAPLIGPQTLVLTAMNGVPWWFFHGLAGEADGLALRSVDPDGSVAAAIPLANVVGCVVHASCSVPQPGVVVNKMGRRLIVGSPNAPESPSIERVRALAGVLEGAGLEAPVSEAIQRDVWYKLWGNMTMNPVSALTEAPCDRILDDPLVNAFCVAVMTEAQAIGARIGCPIAESGADRNQVTRKLGSFKTSMLQDLEAGRELEIDGLLTAVREIAQHLEHPTPNLDALLGLTRLKARQRGLYPG